MLFEVRAESSIPIYEQIIAQIIFGVAEGGLPPGQLIPSVRDLAKQLLVHPNTVSRAFQELERTGILIPVRGLGMKVSDEAPRLCRERRREIVRARLAEALREAASSALSEEEVHQIVQEEWHRLNGKAKGTKS